MGALARAGAAENEGDARRSRRLVETRHDPPSEDVAALPRSRSPGSGSTTEPGLPESEGSVACALGARVRLAAHSCGGSAGLARASPRCGRHRLPTLRDGTKLTQARPECHLGGKRLGRAIEPSLGRARPRRGDRHGRGDPLRLLRVPSHALRPHLDLHQPAARQHQPARAAGTDRRDRQDDVGAAFSHRRHRAPRPTGGLVQVEYSRLGSYIWLWGGCTLNRNGDVSNALPRNHSHQPGSTRPKALRIRTASRVNSRSRASRSASKAMAPSS